MVLVTAAYLIFLFAPMALLVVGSFGETWTNSLLPSGLTDHWYLKVLGDPTFRRAFLTSLEVVLVVCVLNVVVGTPLAYAIHAAAGRGVRFIARIMTLLPIAVPPLVVGFGFIIVFSSDALPWLGSTWLLIAAHLLVTLPYFVNILVADMGQLGLTELERLAATLGAKFPARFVDIVLPSIRYSLLTGLITASAISIGEFQISNLIAGFLTRTYPIVLLQAFYAATGFACAATVILLVLAILAASAGAATARLAKAG